jgi:hypothetical protein
MMDTQALLLLLHILLFVYWLGGDLGVYYSSGFIVRADLPVPTRAVLGRIMLVLDMIPRVCLVLTLPVGLALAVERGFLDVPAGLIPAVAVAGLAWLLLIITIFRQEHHPIAALLTRIDWFVRLAVVAALVVTASLSLTGNGPQLPLWLAVKLLIFAGIIACGLIIRVWLKPFTVAFGQLLRDGSSPATEQALSRGLALVKPPVLLIWVGLVACAWLGITQPA